jgi:hypothetical protein
MLNTGKDGITFPTVDDQCGSCVRRDPEDRTIAGTHLEARCTRSTNTSDACFTCQATPHEETWCSNINPDELVVVCRKAAFVKYQATLDRGFRFSRMAMTAVEEALALLEDGNAEVVGFVDKLLVAKQLFRNAEECWQESEAMMGDDGYLKGSFIRRG